MPTPSYPVELDLGTGLSSFLSSREELAALATSDSPLVMRRARYGLYWLNIIKVVAMIIWLSRVITLQQRAKFVLVAWTPDDAPVLRKARMSVHRASVKEIWRDFSYELCASDQSELDEQKVKDTVVKAGGANYMGQGSA